MPVCPVAPLPLQFFITGINSFLQSGGNAELCIMQFEVIRHGFEQAQHNRYVEGGSCGGGLFYFFYFFFPLSPPKPPFS